MAAASGCTGCEGCFHSTATTLLLVGSLLNYSSTVAELDSLLCSTGSRENTATPTLGLRILNQTRHNLGSSSITKNRPMSTLDQAASHLTNRSKASSPTTTHKRKAKSIDYKMNDQPKFLSPAPTPQTTPHPSYRPLANRTNYKAALSVK
ncbi:unnamed protein product [Pleuronectes platessa]|uniref:Uncharacterized protein n=1 Tax=Pleuronectes platessa TaxID=8262 RepID=A0A9N7U6N8_PLEPL|nr:unnamed protein product [Pleuronectes platessa]